MLLGACRLKNRILVTAVGICLALSVSSCGGYNTGGGGGGHQSRLKDRVLASQGVTANFNFGGLVFINGQNDTIPRLTPLSAGSQPGIMAVSPSRNIVIAFDAATNGVFASNTVNETSMGHVQLQGPSSSIIVPTADPVGYSAVPSASVPGFNVLGAVDVMNLNTGAITTTIGVSNAQTVISNANNTQLLVLSATGTNSVNA